MKQICGGEPEVKMPLDNGSNSQAALMERESARPCIWQLGWALPLASTWSLWSQLCGINGFNRRDARDVAT